MLATMTAAARSTHDRRRDRGNEATPAQAEGRVAGYRGIGPRGGTARTARPGERRTAVAHGRHAGAEHGNGRWPTPERAVGPHRRCNTPDGKRRLRLLL